MDHYYASIAAEALNRAGHTVNPDVRIPGLYNIAGIASDVTVGQLWQIAQQRGVWNAPVKAGMFPPTMVMPR